MATKTEKSDGLLVQLERDLEAIQAEHNKLSGEVHTAEHNAQKIASDIKAAQDKRDELLAEYRKHISNGDKSSADKVLDRVAEQRDIADSLSLKLRDGLQKASELAQRQKELYKRMCTAADPKVLEDIRQRTQRAISISNITFQSISSISGQIEGLRSLCEKSPMIR